MAELREEVSQGDVFDNFPVVDIKFDPNGPDPKTVVRRTNVLLSNDCDYDNCRYVMVAEIRPLTTVAPEHQDTVRIGRSRRTFYLSGHPNRFAESYADFRCIHRVAKEFIGSREQAHPRLASLTDEERLALRRSIAVFFGVEPSDPV